MRTISRTQTTTTIYFRDIHPFRIEELNYIQETLQRVYGPNHQFIMWSEWLHHRSQEEQQFAEKSERVHIGHLVIIGGTKTLWEQVAKTVKAIHDLQQLMDYRSRDNTRRHGCEYSIGELPELWLIQRGGNN